ncbi:glycosyltransferase family 2 protein [Candidatus Pacearchaeota archaeon]|nr:glycosyltransferase family 2 protein [Candidatus Pacearchaeota archaeon]
MKRAIKHFFIFLMLSAIALLVLGKIYYTNHNHLVLFLYGVTVTTVVFFTFFITYVKYQDPYEAIKSRSTHKKPLISCVFAVYNDGDVIKPCMDSLINSTYKNKEIIVVNDASTDSTKEILKQYQGIKGVKVINLTKNVGKKKAIGQGVRVAKGEIFVFTDSDSVVAPDAIERVIEIFIHDPLVGAVSGHARALNADENLITKVQDSWYETQFSVKKAFESAYNSVCCVSGPLAVFRREAIYNYIPAWENDTFLGKEFRFATDRQLTGYVLGNMYIGHKLKKKYAHSPFVYEVDYPPRDWKVMYCKSAKVWTVVPNTFKKVLRQHIRWKKSFIRSLFFTGTFYWRKPKVAAAKYYLGALFALIGPFIALRHLIYLPLRGSMLSGIFYLSGILFVGSLYGIYFKIDNPNASGWYYRPLMSIFSTLVLSWLIFYSALTINKSIWHRG